MSRANDLFVKLKKDGEKEIDNLIETRQSEKLFLDFKRSSDDGEGKILSDKDRNHLAKAISGFGNSEGGVIIWGVNCSNKKDGSDLPDTKYPIRDAKKFVSQLEGSISGLTLPSHSKVENISIVERGSKEGFVITYIPQSQLTPIQAIYNKHFYIRAGSSFEIIPYQVLAGLFGRRPQPYVFNMYTISPAKLGEKSIEVQVGFLLCNEGLSIAKDLFINVKIMSSPGSNCVIGFDTPDLKNWSGGFSFGRFMSLISKSDLRIAPDAHVQPLILQANFSPPFTDDLVLKISCGCSGYPTMKSTIKTTKEEIENIFDKYTDEKYLWKKETGHKVSTLLFKTESKDKL